MSTTKILTYVFAVIAAGLAYYLYYSINSKIEETERIERIENRVIEQLKMIREAELAYLAVNGRYTSDWEKLLAFVDTGSFFITSRKETIITLSYGRDSIAVEIDTLGSVMVKDSIFTTEKWPKFNLATLPFVPETDPPVKFDIWTDKITKGNLEVNAIEVKDPKPANPARDEESEYNTRKPLRFGSRSSTTVTGNWE